MDPYSWSWNPEALLLVPAMTVGYFWALRRAPAPRWRIACWLAAMALLLAVTITPIDTISLNFLLSVHLIQNVVLAEWAPLLVALAIPPALAAHVPRVPPLPALALWAGQLRRLAPALDLRRGATPPPLAPPPRARSLLPHRSRSLVAGRPRRLTAGATAAYVFAAFLLASPIGLMLALVPDPIYDFYVDAPRLWGLSPILDQQIAGVSMAAAEAVVFFAVFAFFFVRFFAEQDAVA